MPYGESEKEGNSGSHSLTAVGGKELLFLGEEGGAVQHSLDDLFPRLQAQLGQLVEHTVSHMVPLQWQEGHQDVQEVLFHDAGAPEAICRKGQRGKGLYWVPGACMTAGCTKAWPEKSRGQWVEHQTQGEAGPAQAMWV